MITSKKGLAAALLLVLIAASATGARGGEIKRVRLDPMTTYYEGLDLNGDRNPDFVRINILTEKCTILLGQEDGRPKELDMIYVPEEEMIFFPDLIREVDLDGNKINDLLMVNLQRLKSKWEDKAVLERLLDDGIYIGLQRGTFEKIDIRSMNDREIELLVKKVEEILIREPRFSSR